MDKSYFKYLVERRKSWIETLDDIEKSITDRELSEKIRISIKPLVKIYTDDIRKELVKSHKNSDV